MEEEGEGEGEREREGEGEGDAEGAGVDEGVDDGVVWMSERVHPPRSRSSIRER
jgi:hypothetical protein